MKKNMVLSILFIMIVFMLTACADEKKGEKKAGTVNVYYLETKTLKIVKEDHLLLAAKKEDKVRDLLQVLTKTPKNVLYKNALPKGVVDHFKFINNEKLSILSIYYNLGYGDLNKVEEALCRAAVVKTLTQIRGVDCVEFYVDDKPLLNSNGDKVGLLYGKDFIDSPKDEADYKVSLYFSNPEGKKLIEYGTAFTGDDTVEEWVVQQLINGPTKSGMKRTIPEGTTLLNISTKEGICTVDFNEKFLEKVPGVDDKVVIYSVVNSLVSIPNRNINKVQFLINGEIQDTYMEDISFDGLFERDLSMNQEGE
jgi:germination protein M